MAAFMAAHGRRPAPGTGASPICRWRTSAIAWAAITRRFRGIQVAPLADMTALAGALADVRPSLLGGVPQVWEKLKAGIENMAASESDPVRRQAVQQAL